MFFLWGGQSCAFHFYREPNDFPRRYQIQLYHRSWTTLGTLKDYLRAWVSGALGDVFLYYNQPYHWLFWQSSTHHLSSLAPCPSFSTSRLGLSSHDSLMLHHLWLSSLLNYYMCHLRSGIGAFHRNEEGLRYRNHRFWDDHNEWLFLF